MPEQADSGSLPHHLERLAADADAIAKMINAQHADGGDIHPEALPKAERLATSLRDVIDALIHHEHLAMGGDDVWRALTLRHEGSTDGTIT